ncbi:restriction endonuclease subunit S [Streptomyces griseoincarnatus]
MTIPLKYVAYVNPGQSPPSQDVTILGEGLPFLQGNAEFQDFHPAPRLECNTAPKQAKKGDILLSVRAPVGALNIADQAYGIGRGLCSIQARQCDSRFLWWWLHTQRPQLDAISTGTTYKSVTAEDVGNLQFSTLDAAAQHHVANFLDAEIARLDTLEIKRSTQLNSLKERNQSLLDSAFESCTSGVPVRLKNLLINRPRYGVLVPHFVEEGVPFIRVNDLPRINDRANQLRMIPGDLSEQYARTVVRPGDLLMSVVGSLRHTAIASDEISGANIARAVCSIRVAPGINVELVRAWLGTSSFLAQDAAATSTDTAQPTLGMEDLGNFRLVWPAAPDERRRMVEKIHEGSTAIQQLETALTRQRTVLRERRQSLITAAVSGQFDVSAANGRNVTEGVSA